MITQDRLKELYTYDPVSGLFTRNKMGRGFGTPGTIAGSLTNHGYLSIQISAKNYLVHRLAWLYMEGYFPENDIDHINRNKTDNRWENLRHVSRSCNCINSGIRKDNSTGVAGVRYCTAKHLYSVRISVDGVSKFIGNFSDKLEAIYHRMAAEQCLGWDLCIDHWEKNEELFSIKRKPKVRF